MIRFFSPGFAWALAAPLLIAVLYLLRRKYLPRQVPSVFLWQRSIRDYAANRPLQRLVKSLLLVLQLLAAAVAAFALMRPAIPGGTAGHTILVFDVSASMQAETSGRTRLDLAKEAALELLQSMPAEERVTVLAAGDSAERLVFSAERGEAEKAILSVAPSRGGADLTRALALADALAREGESPERASLVVYSDECRAEDVARRDPDLRLTVVNCGRGEENRAVYSLAAERGQAYARIANFGEDCTVTLACEADGVLCDAKELEIAAGETAGIGFAVPETAQKVRVSLREKDALAADDAAEAAVKQARSRKAVVLSDSVFLESALRVRTDLTVLRTEPAALASVEADLFVLGTSPLIFTRSLPEDGYDPSANAFGVFRWPEEEVPAEGTPAAEIADDPLTGGLTMRNVFFRSFRPVEGGTAAVRLEGAPLISRTEDTVVLGFDPHQSNLPLKYDFPVLIQNILEYLLPEAGEEAENADGGLIPLRESDTRTVAPDLTPDKAADGEGRGRELTGILLAALLILMVAEMGVSRYVG